MGIKLRGWKSGESTSLPDPILEDDSDQFPEEDVKNVRAWLASTRQEMQARFDAEGPTPIFIQLGRGRGFAPEYCIGTGVNEGSVTFRHATAEVRLPLPGDRNVLATYHFIVARQNDRQDRVILGPRLQKKQLQRMPVCSLS